MKGQLILFPYAGGLLPAREPVADEMAEMCPTMAPMPIWAPPPAVYFLYDSTSAKPRHPVYIGSSVQPYVRVAGHHAEGTKKFDSATYLRVDLTTEKPQRKDRHRAHLEYLHRVEAAFIRFFKPPLNGHPPKIDKGDDVALLAPYSKHHADILRMRNEHEKMARTVDDYRAVCRELGRNAAHDEVAAKFAELGRRFDATKQLNDFVGGEMLGYTNGKVWPTAEDWLARRMKARSDGR